MNEENETFEEAFKKLGIALEELAKEIIKLLKIEEISEWLVEKINKLKDSDD